MPKRPLHLLTWSAEHEYYTALTEGQLLCSFPREDEQGLQNWLITRTSFAFQGQAGQISVIKETRQGKGYWYAYRSCNKHKSKRYLGKTSSVTLARLEEVATLLVALSPVRVSSSTDENPVQEATSPALPSFTLLEPSAHTLLLPRLAPPRLPAIMVKREHLLEQLDQVFKYKLTVISAPAGFGKTTLLSAWVERRSTPVAWLSLEKQDNDPVRFWLSLIEALRHCWPGIGERSLSLLQSSTSSLTPLVTILPVLLNELADWRAGISPILLILDDYHVINEPVLHSLLTFLLEHLPPRVHLLLASRVDPDLPLARLRVRGHLGEIGHAELRFTREETWDFLTQCMGISLSETDVELLQTRTEGWVASLQLTALALRKHADPSAHVQSLSSHQQFLLDYLREEVVESLPQTLQDFLLQTSILHRFSASLCDAVTGKEGSELLLAQVERANLFLHPLDESRKWYRYHALWAQALQHEARLRLGVAAVRGLYDKASRWYEQQRMLPEAIEAALVGEAFTRAAELIERFVAPNSFRNEYHLLRSWLERIPEEILQIQPETSFLFALASMFTTNRRSSALWRRVEALLQWTKRGFEEQGQWEHLGEALQLHADLTFFQEDLARLFALTRQAQPLLTEQSPMYPDHLVCRGIEAWFAGEVDVAWGHLLAGYERLKNLGDHATAFAVSLLLGEVCLEKGELRTTAHYYQQALAHVALEQPIAHQQFLLATGDTEPFLASWAYHCLAQLAYERNELTDARRYCSQAQLLRNTEKEVHVLSSGAFIQARLLYASGEPEQALELLSQWEIHARFPWCTRAIRACQVRLKLAQGNLFAAEQWMQEKKYSAHFCAPEQPPEPSLLQQQEEALLVARLHIARKRSTAALKVLAPWKEKAQAQQRKRSLLEILMLETLAYVAGQEYAQARRSAAHLLAQAEAEGYVRLFLDAGSPMQEVLQTFFDPFACNEPSGTGNLLHFVTLLLDAFKQETSGPSGQQLVQAQKAPEDCSPGISEPSLIRRLTPREQEVLRLLAIGVTNQEIAERLVIGLATAKKHVGNILNKLGAENRTQAIMFAREAALL